MFTENACRASQGGTVTAAQLEPDPKNPIIAAFFREIGFADQFGSGVRKFMKYAQSYGGHDPVFEDGDIFRVSVSLPTTTADEPVSEPVKRRDAIVDNPVAGEILQLIRAKPGISRPSLMEKPRRAGLQSGELFPR